MNNEFQSGCLFIGGSADGQWLEVDASRDTVRVPSLSGQPALQDPVAKALDNDPIPDETVVYETYRRIDVEGHDEVTHVYALNALSPEAIQVQMIKYFGDVEQDVAGFQEAE